jgi:hypothetical protein
MLLAPGQKLWFSIDRRKVTRLPIAGIFECPKLRQVKISGLASAVQRFEGTIGGENLDPGELVFET